MPAHSRFVGQGSELLLYTCYCGFLTAINYGTALKFLDPTSDVPWQRVITSAGQIAQRGPDGAQRQRDALEQEGVHVQTNRAGEFTVDLREYGWFPEALAD